MDALPHYATTPSRHYSHSCPPRRILLLITDLEIGGTPSVVRELAVRLHDPPRVVIEVACLSRWGPVAQQIQSAGIGVTALDARGSWDLRTIGRLVSLIRLRGFDTIFSFLIHANAAAAAASAFCRDVRLLQSIQTAQPHPAWHWRLQGWVQEAAQRIAVPSPSVAEIARLRGGVPPEKLVVIPNAVEIDSFPRSPIPQDPPRPYPIGFIGRLDPIKRLPDLLEAAAQLRGRVHLHVFGDGVERGAVERRIDSPALRDTVTLHGAVSRPQEALARVGMLVLPSAAEGFGLVLIEAMAAGVPVVSTNAPGIRDVVTDGQTGLLVPVGSPTALAAAITRIIQDESLRARLIDQALTHVREHFAWPPVLAQYRRFLSL